MLRRRYSWRYCPAARSCASRINGQCAETRLSTQFAQMFVDKFAVRHLTLQFGLIKPSPSNKVARLLQFFV